MKNFAGQEPWELRGANDARIWALETKPSTSYYVNAIAAAGSTNSTSFVDYPGAAAFDRDFTKVRANTALLVQGFAGAYKTTNIGFIELGLAIAGTDHLIGRFYFNDLSSHRAIPFFAPIAPALAAGSYTARLRWRTENNTANTDLNDVVHYVITEGVTG